jgi:hypothetical protein
VTDGTDSAGTSFTWTLVAPGLNTAPSITNPGDQSGEVGQSVSLSIAASDPDIGDRIAFGATGLPPGLAIDAYTGEITGVADTAGSYTVTVTVADGNGGTDSTTFSWSVCDPNGGCDTLDFNVYVTQSYTSQDRHKSVSVEDGGATIILNDNTWRRTVQTFDITSGTVLEFDFEAIGVAEVVGIGFDSNDAVTNDRVFKLFGSQGGSWFIEDFETYTGSGVTHYQIPVGQYFTGAAMNLVFVNDYDAGTGPKGRFSNVRIYVLPPN